MKKNILITGGTGYIGSHAVVAFEQAGYTTIIVDNLSNSSQKTLEGIQKIIGYCPDFYECDLRDTEALQKIFENYKFDGVIHFAGLKAPFESQSHAIKYFENNISGSICLFSCMEQFGVNNIVFSSSASTYNPQNISPVAETASQKTSSPYGTTKYIVEKILSDLSNFSDFKVMNLRYFNPIGANGSGFLGELPNGIPNNLFPYIFQVVSGERKELQIFGNDYNTPDGTGIRDYIDVQDLVKAHILAYRKLEDTGVSFYKNYNVGTGKGISVLEVIQEIQAVLGKKVNYSFVKRRTGDIPISFCDTSKLRKDLGFQASIDLQESIRNSWNFYSNTIGRK